jgi:hypothetical protein
LINYNEVVKVAYMGKPKCGGNGDIQKCFIENDPAIPRHWEFATKKQKGDTLAVQKIQFNAKAMALRFAHEDCIKWIVVHPFKPGGYTLGWNGGTIRKMMRDKERFNHKNVHITL